ncbi:MAG: hypothetical protein R3C05_29130 [Pirellulaceae bacterium]
MWHQKQITLAAKRRGFHLVTREIVDQLPELKSIDIGLRTFSSNTIPAIADHQ